MSARSLIRYLEGYAHSFSAPVVGDTEVLDVSAGPGGGYRVVTSRGTWRARHVVVATGPHGEPRVPRGLDPGGAEVVPASRYRNADRLASGAVLVIGASSTGVQIADELTRAGREVVLAVGRHTRVPRTYRGLDIFRWLDLTGRLARTIDDVPDPAAARREPSLQLIGHADHDDRRDVDLAALQARGVRLVGRFVRTVGGEARFAADLGVNAAAADERMRRLLDAIDEYVAGTGLRGVAPAGRRPAPLPVPAPTRSLDLAGITTVVVATGYRPHHPWLTLPITAADGTIRQYRGVTPAPGVYVVGQRFQHRRDSGFIHGARHDARAVVRHLVTGHTRPVPGRREEPAA
jgi:putative flavoprotein involved in K+ transport